MIPYRKILEKHFQGISQRTNATLVRSSRNTVKLVIEQAKEKGVKVLTEDMTDHL